MKRSVFFLFCAVVCCLAQRVSIDREPINLFFSSLNYDPGEVLVYKGKGVSSFQKREGELDDQKKFIVTTREKKTLNNGQSDIGVIVSNEHVTYPGALLSANSDLMDNNPRFLAFDRQPLQYTVNLPGLLGQDAGFKIKPTFNDYKKSLNQVLKTWFENYTKDHGVIALFESDSTFAYSKEQLSAKFGTDFKTTSVISTIDFQSIDNQEKTFMVHKFKQIFYTVSVVPSMRPADLFKSTVTIEELESKIDNNHPAVMVDSVSYGRMIYVVMETSSTDSKSKALMEAKLASINIHLSTERDYSKELKDFCMRVFVMGGSSNHIELINARTLKDVADVIIKYKKFNRTNLGYPITYSTRFIKDNARAIIRSTAEYTEVTRDEYPKGILRLVHYGGYVAEFDLSWDEVHYDDSGDEVIMKRNWAKNQRLLTAPFTTEIELPGNARNIGITAWECTGLAWEWWRTIIDRTGIPLVEKREVKISGTTLFPKLTVTPKI